jgi:ArsR family transcriptional regulator, arsenate/arsenite/antimonite-responsive transcriptional repressor
MDMKHALRVFGALSDENRVRALYALRHGELCVCQLIELLGLSPSTVSKHLSILRNAGLLDSRKEGRWVYYRLADQAILPMIGKKTNPFFQSLENSATVKGDDKHLRQIRKMAMEDLCRKIMKR